MVQLIIIIVYLLAMISLGLATRRQARDASGFFVAGRKGSTIYITGSLLATIIGASATIGMAGLGFSRGLTGSWWILVGAAGLVALGFLFARKVRDYGFVTLPQLIEKQYDGKVALAGSLLIVVAWMGVIAGQIIAVGKIMAVLDVGTPAMWMYIATGVFVFYTVLGGQRAVLKTDLWQTIIIFAGIFTGLGYILYKVGGLSALRDSLPSGFFSFPLSPKFDFYQFAQLLLLVGLTYLVGPDMYSRLFSAKDGKVAKKSVFWTALLLIPIALGITLIGMAALVFYPNIVEEQAFPTVMKELLPPVLAGLVMAALLSAVMSSAVTCLLSASTILTVNIMQKIKPNFKEKDILTCSRVGIVILGLIALGSALVLKGIINSLMFAYAVYTAGLIPVVIAGFYKEKLKVTSWGAIVAVAGGGGTALIAKINNIKYLDLGALGISLVLLFTVSVIQNYACRRKAV